MKAGASIMLLSFNATLLEGAEDTQPRTRARRHDEPLGGSASLEDDGKGVIEGAILGSKAATACGNALRTTRSTLGQGADGRILTFLFVFC
jgi:hypothetical protein